jgi:ABC-type transport system involved in multi-copper enzyme maturation permease subunit
VTTTRLEHDDRRSTTNTTNTTNNTTTINTTTEGTTMNAPLLLDPPASLATHPIRPLRFSTILSVELRKATDTRSGRGLLALIGGLTVLVLGWKITHAGIETTFHSYSLASANAVAFLAPVIGLLALTSEWTQRTALTTLTLAPRRGPVIAAKFLSAIILSLGLVAIGMVLSFAGTALGGAVHSNGHASYSGWLGDIRSFAIIVVLQVVMACAFGALAGQTAVALVAFFVAPTVWAAVSSELLKGASPWFDIFQAYDQLSSDQPLQHITHSLTAVGIWVVLPAVVGIARTLRREVK